MNNALRKKNGIRPLVSALATTAAVATQAALQSATRLPDRNLEELSGFRMQRVCSADRWRLQP